MKSPLLRPLILFAFLAVLCPCTNRAEQSAPLPFRNPDLPIEKRVDDLIGRLTVEEKIAQLLMNTPAIPRLGVPAYCWWSEALHGVARNGLATVFPQAIALAATWNPELHEKIADTIATEARAKNNETIRKSGGDTRIYEGLTIWSPNINIFRDPRWGRGQETYGEDPFLTGRMGVAFVRGLQGNDPTYLKTVATVKHYAVHSGPESSRHRFDAVVSPRDLRETYLPAFEAGIREGNSWSIMTAYNAVNGVPAPASTFLLRDILRTEWGFKGAVVGDVDNVADMWMPGTHEYSKDAAEASATALKAGNDLCSGSTYRALPESLKRGLVTEADFDTALRRLFYLRFKLGQFDPPERVPFRQIPLTEVNAPTHDQLALEAARQSLVLLKNDGSLPWNPKDLKTVAILGPTADDNSALLGNYSGSPVRPVNILQGLRAKLEPMGIKVISERAIPLVTGFRETGQAFSEGVLFTDETKSLPGLKGEVFDNEKFEGAPQTTRTDEQVDFLWNEAQPVPGIPVRDAHVRWSGVLVPPKTDDYALSLTFVGGAKLFLDDKLITAEEKSRDRGQAITSGAGVKLNAGQIYHLRVEYHQQKNEPTARIQLGWRPPGGLDKALAKAKEADHIILALGITPNLEGEEMKVIVEGFDGGDRTSILLPKAQRDLIDAVAALGKPFVVVLTNGSALSFDVTKPNAVLEAWYYGQRGGDAVAEALLGEMNPSGRLPITFYQSEKDLPAFDDYSMTNRTYRYFTGKPLFAFGHGLSYTTFKYGEAELSKTSATSSDIIDVKVDVTNTGKLAGDEVVQIYAHALQPPVPMPLQTLVGFRRVPIAPGETKTVTIPVPAKNLRRWEEKTNRYVVDPGSYELRVGRASDNIVSRATLRIQ
jgi:beta-glucosidase